MSPRCGCVGGGDGASRRTLPGVDGEVIVTGTEGPSILFGHLDFLILWTFVIGHWSFRAAFGGVGLIGLRSSSAPALADSFSA